MGASHITVQTLDVIPDLLALHAKHRQRYPHLLASIAKGNDLARYDILFACSQQTITFDAATNFLDELDTAWTAESIAEISAELPFSGGWFLYLGYELAAEIEPGLKLPPAEDGLPVAFATRFPAAIIVDHKLKQAHLVVENKYSQYLNEIQQDLQSQNDKDQKLYKQEILIDQLQEDDEKNYLQQVARLKKYIIDGDVFQVNLSRAWKTRLKNPINDASLFYHLSKNNPGPFNALVTLGEQAIICSSPERLIEVKNNIVQTRPIAGTRPRSANEEEDQSLSDELMEHPKERAEHIMLIDLERNDLGRICKLGSVDVNELMVLETYQHVHHIVSNVKGRLKDNITPGQVIKAVFPGGTITGCPKVRCMEILAELEQTGRGAYTGSLGFLNHDGSMDLNILIRTIVRKKSELRFRAGGGIVADSEPQHELNETRAKAKGLIMALQD